MADWLKLLGQAVQTSFVVLGWFEGCICVCVFVWVDEEKLKNKRGPEGLSEGLLRRRCWLKLCWVID